jgi:hypothetical protein
MHLKKRGIKMKNYKLDIKEMTEQFNNANSAYDTSWIINQDEMAEMVQRHAFKLGYKWNSGDCDIIEAARYIHIHDCVITHTNLKTSPFNENLKQIGLEFFSIMPVKMRTVRMPEDSLDYMRKYHSRLSLRDLDYNKWELVE